jgi:cell division septum initiation protein DivIVA
MEKSGNNDILELMGYTTTEVGTGLDPNRVIPFIRQLISERDTLNKRLEHLSSLTRLIEKTIADADDLAAQIGKETREQAEADSKAIIARAEEQAQELVEAKRSEAISLVQKETEAFKEQAHTQMEAALKDKLEELKGQLRYTAEQLYRNMVAQAESFKEQTTTFEKDLEHKLAELTQQNSLTGIIEPAVAKDSDASLHGEIAVSNVAAESPDATKSKKGNAAPKTAPEATRDLEIIELEILPPRDQDKITAIKAHLDTLPGVTSCEMTTKIDRTLLRVTLSKPVDLVDELQKLREVLEATLTGEGKQKKIDITLSTKAELEAEKRRINSQVNRIFSETRRPVTIDKTV